MGLGVLQRFLHQNQTNTFTRQAY